MHKYIKHFVRLYDVWPTVFMRSGLVMMVSSIKLLIIELMANELN